MALTIENATVGYDANGIEQLLNNINTNVVEESHNKLGGGLNDLETTIEEIWRGESSTIFRNNMRDDVQKVEEAIDQVYDVLRGEISQIVEAMTQVDQNLIKNRA